MYIKNTHKHTLIFWHVMIFKDPGKNFISLYLHNVQIHPILKACVHLPVNTTSVSSQADDPTLVVWLWDHLETLHVQDPSYFISEAQEVQPTARYGV